MPPVSLNWDCAAGLDWANTYGKNKAVNCDEVLCVWKAHEPELRAAGVVSVSVFGSTARRESTPADVDLAVRRPEDFSHGGFDYFGRLEDLEQHLSQLLGCKVDVVEEPARKERLQKDRPGPRPCLLKGLLADCWTSSRTHKRFCDIRLAWTSPALGQNRLVYDAVECCLERISEAAAKLGELAPVLMPGLPWRDIRALGNRFTPLLAVYEAALRNLPDSG
jgi:predicted nucleotidyltransferase